MVSGIWGSDVLGSGVEKSVFHSGRVCAIVWPIGGVIATPAIAVLAR